MTKIDQKIPEGWCVNEFSKIALLSKEKYIPSPNEHIKCLELEHFEKETGLLKGYIDSAQQSSAKNCFKKGDVLYGKLRSYLKKYTLAPFDGVCSTEIWVLRGYKEKLINTYLYLIIQTSKFNTACSVSTGTHMPRADWEYVSNIPFIYPPLAEQEKIAEILSCWDEGIEKLSALIEKKKLQKKALMQQLLTAKIRLPAFTDPWKNVKLGNFLIFQTGFPFDSQFFNQDGDGIRLIKNRDLKSDDQMYFYSGNYSTDDIVNDGDILVGMDGDFLPCLWKKGRALLNQRVGRVICNKNLNHIFAYYALSSPLEKIQNKTASTTVKHLSHAGVLEIKTIIPSSLAEQKAIAEILSKADEEIELLNKKLEAFKLEKKALMQKLLTGQIRVKVN